jgi:peroxiredoxin
MSRLPLRPVSRRHSRTRSPALLATLLLAVLVAVSACSGASEAPEAGGQYRYVSATPKGTVIPQPDRKPVGAVVGTQLDGSTFTLSAELGKVVLINFWGSWCGPCVAETPELQKIYVADQSQGVLFVGVAVKDEKADTQAFVTDNAITYPIVYDFNAKTALQLGNIPMRGLPATVVIDKQGKVAGVFVGPVLAGDVNPVVATLLAES